MSLGTCSQQPNKLSPDSAPHLNLESPPHLLLESPPPMVTSSWVTSSWGHLLLESPSPGSPPHLLLGHLLLGSPPPRVTSSWSHLLTSSRGHLLPAPPLVPGSPPPGSPPPLVPESPPTTSSPPPGVTSDQLLPSSRGHLRPQRSCSLMNVLLSPGCS